MALKGPLFSRARLFTLGWPCLVICDHGRRRRRHADPEADLEPHQGSIFISVEATRPPGHSAISVCYIVGPPHPPFLSGDWAVSQNVKGLQGLKLGGGWENSSAFGVCVMEGRGGGGGGAHR